MGVAPDPAVPPPEPAPRGSDWGGAETAPHVHSAVRAACGGEPALTAEVLAALSPEQRRGWRALPDPLPHVPAFDAYRRQAVPQDVDPGLLLALALCSVGGLPVLGLLTGSSSDRIAASPLGRLVRLRGGAFRLSDPALRASVLAASTTGERIGAHRLLASAFEETGDPLAALWHRARGAVCGDPRLVEPLLDRAGAALRAGSADCAWAFATEAVEHAQTGTDALPEALLCAAHAALAGGCVVDALECAEGALRLDGAHRDAARATFVLAHALRHGTVPGPERLLPGDPAVPGFHHAAVLGASLSAERGDHERTIAWLAAGARAEHASQDRIALRAWCELLAGEGTGATAIGDGDEIRRVARALCAGLQGDPDAGLRALAEPEPRDAPEVAVGLPVRGPLLRARRAVAEALLHVWAGRISIARDLLRSAADRLPVAFPFGGLAVSLSRRLDLAVDGRIGAWSKSLEAAAPWAREPGGFVDRAIGAYLQGRSDEAAVHLRLWDDRGRPAERFGLPGLDEVGPLSASGGLEPPETTTARRLRERVRAAREASWRADLETVAEESRGVCSPFERARVEALLGSTCAARGDLGRGVRHLRAAQSLFEEAGAHAWRGLVERRLRAMGERAPVGGGAAASSAQPALEVCRAVWDPILTAREMEVALLMADGRPNREIAHTLHVSVRTVEVHGGRIFAKLDVRTRHELTVLAHRTDQHL
ncbi:LuxR family transcriptional regulator [uncultured Microbacterium sp.]|uniref:LuxR family transcriptional regulator n=1 Tax=uncultured Microbacterium sp. TaxID=191216 RepID=UPI0025E34043|nr:LuxR family transcriptional regulator [uncultured Microbacterium sp.]